MRKRTKIVCTIGPSSHDEGTLASMMRAGMNVARLNFSHGTYADHAALIARVRAAAAACNEPVAVLADLQGPRLRLGALPYEGIAVKDGSRVVFDASAAGGAAKNRVPLAFRGLGKFLQKGERILIDDGQIEVRVEKVQKNLIVCAVTHGGVLMSHKGINLPDSKLAISSLTAKDKKDAAFLLTQGIDFFGFSFVKDARDVEELRRIIHRHTPKKERRAAPVGIIAKIERAEAVRNIEDIIKASDGIMVARGDLGLELPAEEVPLLQKKIIRLCLAAAKPVIVATQMLDSMIRSPRPTRAEVSDVANAVIDHADAVMLSGETAGGRYPVEAVRMMARIASRTERSHFDDVSADALIAREDAANAVPKLARILADQSNARAVLASSLSGATARLLSSFRAEAPVYVATDNARVCRQLNLSWGVCPFVVPTCKTPEELARRSVDHLKKTRTLKKGDKVVLVAGRSVGASGEINILELKTIE